MTPHRYKLYQVDAFTTERFQGNPAGVVTNADGLTVEQMQKIARELNNSETAFVLAPDAADHEVRVRFFTPTTEVPSCGHATIAAHYVRAIENYLPSTVVVQKIGAGILPVEIVRQEEDYKIVMTQGAIEFGEPFDSAPVAETLAALSLPRHALDERCPIQIVSTGHSKVLVPLHSRLELDSLQPDLARLTELSNRIGCNGYFTFTLYDPDPDVLAHGRMFAPAIGIPEDPVTGNANGPLGAYLVRHKLVSLTDGSLVFRARQGEALGRPGLVEVTVETEDSVPKLVRVAGRAVIVFRCEIEL
ncbi:MAG: PhzF family isomerase [Gemmatimonadales bacterium]